MNYVPIAQLAYQTTYNMRRTSDRRYSTGPFSQVNTAVDYRIWLNWAFVCD